MKNKFNIKRFRRYLKKWNSMIKDFVMINIDKLSKTQLEYMVNGLVNWENTQNEFIKVMQETNFKGYEKERECLIRTIKKTLKRFREYKKYVKTINQQYEKKCLLKTINKTLKLFNELKV